MSKQAKGSLIIIGGHENKDPRTERAILEEICRRANKGNGKLLIATVATQSPEEYLDQYLTVLKEMGTKNVEALSVRNREDGHDPALVQRVQEATVIFFTGGDQLRLTSQMCDTPVYTAIHDIYQKGATIAGTSAGAAAMPETMIVAGEGNTSEIAALDMAPGLGLINGVVIDSHFAERGRFGRLLGAVTQNPRNVGLGIDENTAIVVDDERFSVMGSGAVYVFDGRDITYSGLSETRTRGAITIHDVRLHILTARDSFDLRTRRPVPCLNPTD